MGKKWIHILAAFAGIAAFLSIPVRGLALSDSSSYIRIGLYYGSSALSTANLENNTGHGSGYRFGYYDDSYHFTEVASTAQTQISMLKNSNIYLSGTTYYTYAPSGSYSTVGAYHIQLNTVYGSYSAASSAAKMYSGGFPAWIGGAYRARVGSYTTSAAAGAAMKSLGISNAEVVGGSETAITVTQTKTTAILFQFDGNGKNSLVVMPGKNNDVKAITWFKGYRYYGNFQYKRLSGGDLTVINVVPMEDYVKGILPYEMSSSWPREALKAQAVCARSYAACNYWKHQSLGFDLCNTTDCQVYRGVGSNSESSDQAVDDTAGLYVRYGDEIAETVYHSCDGGATEDVKNIWGSDLPYLKGVVDPFESYIAGSISSYYWNVTYTSAELTARLQSKGYACGNVVNVYISEYTPTGNPKTVTFVDSNGKTYSFSRTNLTSIFSTAGKSLRSYRYKIYSGSEEGTGGSVYYVNPGGGTLSSLNGVYALDGTGAAGQIGSSGNYVITGDGVQQLSPSSSSDTTASTTNSTFTISGSGWGHNLGMSQWGAYCMAKQGYTYDKILKFYYTNVTIS
ncbi:MAG: SpoIID/LytB domain-containing protein [Oscillospiraceae bacterium]|mgnify:CR=1 FL=1|nr:SpoIID/LytB domain-containing protein [Oscillospiraceae bacterium]